MKILIYGGSFDPIHLGHINIVKHVQEKLQCDKVIFELAASPRWKEPIVEPFHRLEMLKIAIQDYPNFTYDLFEYNSNKEINYTIDTIKYFKSKFKDAELYFLLGYDQLDKLQDWKDIDDLVRFVHIVAYKRDVTLKHQENIEKYHVEVVDGPLFDVSSTQIRNMESIMLDKRVLRYILENGLYFASKIKNMLSSQRYGHSIEVALLALKTAKYNNLDALNAFVAGLLHDIGKEVPLEEAKKIMNEHFPNDLDLPPFSYHQFVGAYLVETKFQIKSLEVVEAIKYHATGKDNMSALGKVIYAADKIEPTRGFDSSELIASLLNNYEKGFVDVLRANKEYLLLHHKDINNRLTKACMDQYLVDE